nr:glutaredoxin family protein [Actinomycetales bacterium]
MTETGAEARIVLYVREDCHLCDIAHQIVEQVSLESGDEYLAVDIDHYPELRKRFHEDVPVLA